jgi:hypothetical protein
MNRMMSEVLRWQRPPGGRRFSHRWTDWARALTERYAWIAIRRPGLALALVHPWAPIYRFCQRWEQRAWTYAPRLHLAISLLPGQTGRERSPTASAVHLPGASPRQLAPVQARAPMDHPVLNQQLAGSPPGTAPRAGSRQTAAVTEPTDSPGPAPRRRVLRRTGFEEVNESVMVSRVNRESRITQQSRQILRRLVEERQRVEILASRSLVMRQPPPAPAEAAAATGPTTLQSPLGLKVGAPGMAPLFTPAAIDLDLLTEKVVRQIDQRIVAYRERMGKLF